MVLGNGYCASYQRRERLQESWQLLALAEKETDGRWRSTREDTHGFKFQPPDGKQRAVDALCVIIMNRKIEEPKREGIRA